MSVLETLDFLPMLIVDIFRPHKGKRLIAAHREPGKTPFVGGSESFNSITGFSDVEPLFPGGWLTLVYNGSVGQTRLQPAPFFASDDVIALEPIVPEVSHPALLVCASIIQRECVNKYSYGTKLNLQRLSRQTVVVPALTKRDGTIEADWDGMDRLGTELLDQVISSRAHTALARLASLTTTPSLS
ncbi:MAG: restriction endonuclease subunit S [Bowdeniella nasicola]|nr:restriction endonuclease subunit S [Bowdeniella nasicola]